jgi:hypothetical protein
MNNIESMACKPCWFNLTACMAAIAIASEYPAWFPFMIAQLIISNILFYQYAANNKCKTCGKSLHFLQVRLLGTVWQLFTLFPESSCSKCGTLQQFRKS